MKNLDETKKNEDQKNKLEREKRLILTPIKMNNTISFSGTYYKDIRNYPLLSHEEEIELFKKIRKGDLSAREKLIFSNQRLVYNIARKYKRFSLEYDDLVAYGNLGLIRAVDLFDPTKDVAFSTYATYWIKRDITLAIKKSKIIHIPFRFYTVIFSLKNIEESFIQENGYSPSDKELLLALKKKKPLVDISLDRLKALRNHILSPSSLNKEFPSDYSYDNAELIEFIKDESSEFENKLAENITNEIIRDVLKGNIPSNLTDIEKSLLWLHYGFSEKNYTIEEIGKYFNLSSERIRQMEAKALRKLRKIIIDKEILSIEEIKGATK